MSLFDSTEKDIFKDVIDMYERDDRIMPSSDLYTSELIGRLQKGEKYRSRL